MSGRTKGELVYAKEVRPLPEIATVGRVGLYVFGIATPGYPGGDYRNIDCPDPCGESDAAFIVQAWNSHDALVEALKNVLGTLVAQFPRDVGESMEVVREARALISTLNTESTK